MVFVAEEDLVDHGRTSSRNGQASRWRHTSYCRRPYIILYGLWRMCSINIFRRYQTVCLQFERANFRPMVWGLGEKVGPFDSPSSVPISSPLAHVAYLLTFLSYLAGSKIVSVRPTDLDTMTNIALEATASPSGKNCDEPMPNLSMPLPPLLQNSNV